MRRSTLSTKLFAAALPLVLAVAALLAFTVRHDLRDVQQAENGAELGRVWQPLIGALGAIETEVADARIALTALEERRAAIDAADGVIGNLGAPEALAAEREAAARYDATTEPLQTIDLAAARIAADASLDQLVDAVDRLDGADSAKEYVTASRSSLLSGRRIVDRAVLAPDMLVGESDPIGAYERASRDLVAIGELLPSEAGDPELGGELLSVLKLARAKLAADDVITGITAWQAAPGSIAPLVAARQSFAELENSIAVAWFMSRSVTRRVKEVATSANQVATEQLPALVEALRDPRGKTLPTIAPVSTKGGDELSDLAEAFNSMQSTLVDVAHEQVEVLRRGVSDIFVTMARRNRSLIDRQLAMLDEFEAEVDDPDVLSNYYQLDHMATRMRRNSESLLVLANAEPKRRRVKATEIDDVVRAAIGEVEDYRRVEIEALESLQVKGNVVADVSHLLAELLDNATQFSPPDSLVRVGGRRAGDSYMLRIVDNGVGIGLDRLRELNELLQEPPIVGLSVEPTLGMSVVSLLANRHGIGVTLSQGNPGTTVDVLLPSSLFGPIDRPTPTVSPTRTLTVSPTGSPTRTPTRSPSNPGSSWTPSTPSSTTWPPSSTRSSPPSTPPTPILRRATPTTHGCPNIRFPQDS
jgi:signal transduction histidine kinase